MNYCALPVRTQAFQIKDCSEAGFGVTRACSIFSLANNKVKRTR